jgi:serine/threonine protein kinase
VSIEHRDIKPQNLLLVGGSVKVADFGLAQVLGATFASHSGSMTPSYAAPEFINGRTHRHSDQYSLAVSYCLLRGGRLPFEGNPVQVMAGHLSHEPDLTMLSEAERPVVARAMSKKPQDRWPGCVPFVAELRKQLEKPATTTGPTLPVAQPKSAKKRLRRLCFAAAIVSLLILVSPVLWTHWPKPMPGESTALPPGQSVAQETATTKGEEGEEGDDPTVEPPQLPGSDTESLPKEEPPPGLSDPPRHDPFATKEDGFVRLDNGKDFTGWQGDFKGWKVARGVIRHDARSTPMLGMISYETRPSRNSIVRLSCRAHYPGCVCRIFIRGTGYFIPYTPKAGAEPPRCARRAGQWNELEFTFHGKDLVIKMNDEVIKNDIRSRVEDAPKGIALQRYIGGFDFENIRVKNLD